jgi:Glyoxalase/Bleomycin resistance protein/Dioxygenase superfamily
MSVDLFAIIPVSDFTAAVAWYEQLLGRPPTFIAHETDHVWEISEHGSIAVQLLPEHAGHTLITVFLGDFDARIAEMTERGLEPDKRETYENGVRKFTYVDPAGNEISFGGGPAE